MECQSELVRQTDALGQVTQLLHNAAGSVGTEVHVDDTRETHGYNALGYVSRWDYTPCGQAERYTLRRAEN
ncbi:hypothetical protein E2553_09110 [Paraburkholderia dipogonis]|uniref:RHS repeat protein n=1 Tax=Paraburkholderia dipogonis TaxID=1211383 RepID=A0A4Y8N6X2_9BURK|nr:hypothetical protein [Paraburkholderia dipogonis]TFE45158.1 hypothetical protein E2553_09110 [Paraburkholderia dipogonis]